MRSTAIVLFAHGSRDARWREPVEAVARRIAQRSPQTPVAVAYLELVAPELAEAAAALIAAGATRLRVVPLFLGVGKHAREDLPRGVEALRAAHPGVEFELRPAVGESAELIDLLATLALTP